MTFTQKFVMLIIIKNGCVMSQRTNFLVSFLSYCVYRNLDIHTAPYRKIMSSCLLLCLEMVEKSRMEILNYTFMSAWLTESN